MDDDLKHEFSAVRAAVDEMKITLARLDERLNQVVTLRDTVTSLEHRMVKVNGLDGDNGQISVLQGQVKANTDKVQSLMLSRALLAGYAMAAGGIGALVAKFLT